MATIPSLGQVNYEAYRADSQGRSLVTGQPIPTFEKLQPAIQHAWEVAAEAVAAEVVKRQYKDDGLTDG